MGLGHESLEKAELDRGWRWWVRWSSGARPAAHFCPSCAGPSAGGGAGRQAPVLDSAPQLPVFAPMLPNFPWIAEEACTSLFKH